MTSEIRALYDQAASEWQRSEPLLLSDYTARERVFEAVGDIRGLQLWDLGCGEGYVSRRLAALGARQVEGFDLSAAMVEAAQRQATALEALQGSALEALQGSAPQALQVAEPQAPRGPTLRYGVADLADPQQLPPGTCDAAVAVFLFNYLSLAASQRLLAHVHAALRPGGFFLFTVPHPALPYLRGHEPPFFFDPAGHPYLGSDDQIFEGRIWRRDGVANAVRSRHKTLQDYFQLLAASGWQRLPQLEELGVTEAHLALDPAFFGPLRGVPLHLLFLLRR
jgi:SAM-dependent methyltransferase